MPVQVPHVSRQEYTLLDVSEDGFVSNRPMSLFLGLALLV
jgi:hypothetical protein